MSSSHQHLISAPLCSLPSYRYYVVLYAQDNRMTALGDIETKLKEPTGRLNYKVLAEHGNWFQRNCSFLRFTMIFTVTVYGFCTAVLKQS
ncbi:hypothetical protein LXL04_023618 [Taraxacum kok-saghyz]